MKKDRTRDKMVKEREEEKERRRGRELKILYLGDNLSYNFSNFVCLCVVYKSMEVVVDI